MTKPDPIGALESLLSDARAWTAAAELHAAGRHALLDERDRIIGNGQRALKIGTRRLEAMMPLSALSAERALQMEIPPPPSGDA